MTEALLSDILKKVGADSKPAPPEKEGQLNALFDAIFQSHEIVERPFSREEFEQAKERAIEYINSVTLMGDGSILSASNSALLCIILSMSGRFTEVVWRGPQDSRFQDLIAHIKSQLELSRVKTAQNAKVIATVAHEFQMPNI